jgi:hypothetical protein
MPSKDLAQLLGFTVGTVEAAPYWSSATGAPTDKTIAIMRRELLRRTRERIEELRAWREIELAEAERELADHMRMCREAEPEGLNEIEDEAA